MYVPFARSFYRHTAEQSTMPCTGNTALSTSGVKGKTADAVVVAGNV
jgi:hypothetical protein